MEEDDGDMLLFQYGIYNSEFQINFTRQLYEVFDDCHQILHLSLTFYFDPGKFLEIKSSGKWSSDFENPVEIQKFIINSEGFVRANDEPRKKIEFYADLV